MTTPARRPRYYAALHVAQCGAGALAVVGDGQSLTPRVLTLCCQSLAQYSEYGAECASCGRAVSIRYAEAGWTPIYYTAREAGCSDPRRCANEIMYQIAVVKQPEAS